MADYATGHSLRSIFSTDFLSRNSAFGNKPVRSGAMEQQRRDAIHGQCHRHYHNDRYSADNRLVPGDRPRDHIGLCIVFMPRAGGSPGSAFGVPMPFDHTGLGRKSRPSHNRPQPRPPAAHRKVRTCPAAFGASSSTSCIRYSHVPARRNPLLPIGPRCSWASHR